jgi:alkanesulfonate monooxygenase SsuD/methylene tetrahydromethanopterin reductase-like flavin-dependent oxidoreductase (luciferase family)
MEKRVALTVPIDGFTLTEHTELLREAERLGYQDAWSSEVDALDAFSPLAVAGLATGMRLGTAIVNVFTRGPPRSRHARRVWRTSHRGGCSWESDRART